MLGSVVVRRVQPGDMAAVIVLDTTVRREMARNEMTSLLWRLARHPWPYCLLAATWGTVCLLTKLTSLLSLFLALLVVAVEEALRLHTFWRLISDVFGPATDVKNAHSFYSGHNRALFVAEADEEVVGFLALQPHASDSEREAELLRLTIHPSHRKLGVASRLLQEAAEVARRMGFESIVLMTHYTNTKAINCYFRNGYKKIGIDNYARFFPHRMDVIWLRFEL